MEVIEEENDHGKWHKICRMCRRFNKRFNYVNIFTTVWDNATYTVAEAMSDFLGIEAFNEEDDFPDSLCPSCNNQLRDAIALKAQALESHQEFIAMADISSDKDINQVYYIEDLEEPNCEIEMKDDKTAIGTIEIASVNASNTEDDGVSFLLKTVVDKNNSEGNSASNGSNAYRHECNVCHKKFKRKSNLMDHLRLHAGIKPFKCTECDKAFVQIGNLQGHMRIHTKERPFKCHLCPKSYNQSGALTIHIRSHTNEKNYICEICNKGFTNTSDLTKHKRTHDEVKAFKCDFCPKAFAQRVNLRTHIASLHTEKKNKSPRRKTKG